ncbi:MAG: hypothetical protein MRERC_1c014 [Mycoplasmataceae bacterium RC_NB112A]|nr:MAG: hypothetical protein MRERC_1c014 [Mycoplasmataceae bacterium RC_NB112A]
MLLLVDFFWLNLYIISNLLKKFTSYPSSLSP